MTSKFQSLEPGKATMLDRPEDGTRSVHRWSRPELDALVLAQAAQRPLLVRGEPGTGKTQLARAAAQVLGWTLLSEVIHPRFEAQDLKWRYDAIRRLADAQRGGNLQPEAEYWEPGALWRAYGWLSAHEYGNCRHVKLAPEGHVILIDEIDKADSDLPNSLLEVLGQRSFRIPALNLAVGPLPASVPAPLVIITTNEERELPAAFVRRCVVLNLVPEPTQSYQHWLMDRARAHFKPEPEENDPWLREDVLESAASQLIADRDRARAAHVYLPGPAEYLDLLYALYALAHADPEQQLRWLRRLSAYAFIKNASSADNDAPSQRTVEPGADRSTGSASAV